MSEYGHDKGMGVDCKAMEAEEEAKGRGTLVKGTLTCRAAGAEAVTWSKMAESEASASPHLTPPWGFKSRPSWVDSLIIDRWSPRLPANGKEWHAL